MPSRQKHSKTRHGCAKCKQRKVRCDQRKPICRNCERLGHECSYLQGQSSAGPSIQQGVDQTSRPLYEEPISPPHSLPLQDLELMHQYSTSTCFTITDGQCAEYRIWQMRIPQLALQHPFLMHGLLALAAMHLCHMNQSSGMADTYTKLASMHQDLALSTYTPQLRSINQNNCDALFAFSAILGGLSHAFAQVSHDTYDQATIKSIVDGFDLLIGAKVVVLEGVLWIKQGELASLLRPLPTAESSDVPTPYESLAASLDAVSGEIDQMTTSLYLFGTLQGDNASQTVAQDAYKSAIQGLKNTIASLGASEWLIGKVLSWSIVIEGHFVTQLKQQEPLALVILAHYGAVLCRLAHVWWAAGLGSRLIRAVVGVIGGGYYAKFLAAPMAWI